MLKDGKTELVRLDNMAIDKEGKLSQIGFFNFLKMDLDDYSDIVMTKEEAIAFKNSVVRMSYGTCAAIPLRCKGKTCINHFCPFHKKGIYPLAKSCYYEVRMIEFLTRSYMEDIDVEPDCRSEMVLINQLVECDILDFRSNIGLSGAYDEEAGKLLKTSIVETDHSTSETTNIHPLVDVKEKISNRRNKILEFFAVTRKEKYKKAAALKEADGSDASNYLAELKDRTSNLISVTSKKILDSDWDTNDV